MPKRKISIEEAFQVLEQAGIQVQVKQVVDADPGLTLADLVEDSPSTKVKKDYTKYGDSTRYGVKHQLGHTVRIELYAAHSIASGGCIAGERGSQRVEGSAVLQYGPGICWVPAQYAASLLHQDMLARQADARMLDRTFRSYVVATVRDSGGEKNVGIPVSQDTYFDMSGFLGQISNPGSPWSSNLQSFKFS